jgi:hypothetical protein
VITRSWPVRADGIRPGDVALAAKKLAAAVKQLMAVPVMMGSHVNQPPGATA